MKILYLALLASVLSLTIIHTLSISTFALDSTAKTILNYKQKNAIACGFGGVEYSGFAEFISASPLLNTWAKKLPPYTGMDELPYNNLFIPDTLNGTIFNLRMHDTTMQWLPGEATRTMAFNNNSVLGPTLFFKKGDSVQMNVTNEMGDTTTVHWHGQHLPAIMDGGPHQPIAPGTTWHPGWVVKNNAATYWYHPHLHMMTTEQLTMGLAGLIIVRDDAEAALNLPRTYGVDDIPLIIQDKAFLPNSNQLSVEAYGDTAMVNGTLKAQLNVPAQVVRFRVLDGATDRSYNLAFSDSRSFSVISGDAGLLDKPVPVTRYILSAGERIEILVNFSGEESKTVTLKAYNASLPTDMPGSEPDTRNTADYFRNSLGNRDFDLLKLNIVAQNSHPVTSIPDFLVPNTSIDKTEVTMTRYIEMSKASPDACPVNVPPCSLFNGKFFDIDRVDYSVQKGATEIWELTNQSGTAHPFHIHDVSFQLLSKSTGPLAEFEKGWKDVVMVSSGASVRFIAKFEDYADAEHPYMYHCHISIHEDAGMMGQFVVVPSVLPVSLTSFNGLLSGKNIILSWKTANEINTKSYVVERSTNGINYMAVATVNAARKTSYGYTDKNVTSLTGNLYYRLKIIDGDGKFVYSKIINLKPSEIQLNLFPNPVVSGELNVSYSPAFENVIQLNVLDSKGKTIIKNTLSAGTGSFKINVSALTNGIYFLVISDGKKIKKQKFEVFHR